MSSCDFFDAASACIAVAVYFVPPPSGAMLITAVNGKPPFPRLGPSRPPQHSARQHVLAGGRQLRGLVVGIAVGSRRA